MRVRPRARWLTGDMRVQARLAAQPEATTTAWETTVWILDRWVELAEVIIPAIPLRFLLGGDRGRRSKLGRDPANMQPAGAHDRAVIPAVVIVTRANQLAVVTRVGACQQTSARALVHSRAVRVARGTIAVSREPEAICAPRFVDASSDVAAVVPGQ